MVNGRVVGRVNYRCSSCEEVKPAEAFRTRNRGGKTTVRSHCRACEAANQLARPRERKREILRMSRTRNPERYKAGRVAYHKRHQAEVAVRWKAWYERNKEYRAEYAYQQRTADPERYNAQVRARYAADSTSVKNAYHARRARLAAVEYTLTVEEWQKTLVAFNHRCAYCNSSKRIEQDHVVPISKGGGHTKENVVPACRSCNASKGNRGPVPKRLAQCAVGPGVEV